jgi:peptidyl-prolyl cis-trans isomerase SurA
MMKSYVQISLWVIVGASVAVAQVASHAPTNVEALLSAKSSAAQGVQGGERPVVRVNGAVLTGHDLLREMYIIFPYARQHNGFPKQLEPEIRRGALQMIIFEELVYQEAKRRHLTIPPARLARAEADFRKQFPSGGVYEQFLKVEANGSQRVMREKIRRSLLIDDLLETEVGRKATVSTAEAKAYYDKNPKRFEHGDRFSIQTISIIPPQNASPEIREEARKRAEEALHQAKATKSYTEFGLVAERLSDDDWRVNMGDRRQVDRAQLPPPLVTAALKMKPGEVSDLIQLGQNYTLFRLNGYTPAGKTKFAAVKAQIRSELEKAKYSALRSELRERLREKAKVEVL